MKFKFFLLFGILAILLVSCTENEKMLVETETNLQIDVLMSTEIKSGTIPSGPDYSFSGDGTYPGVKIVNFENHLYQIQKIKSHTAPQLSIPEVAGEGAFSSLVLEWGYKGPADNDYMMQESINLLLLENQVEEGIFTIELGEVLIHLINNLNRNPENSIRVRLTGTSNFNFNSMASLKIPVIVESETMNVRFELF